MNTIELPAYVTAKPEQALRQHSKSFWLASRLLGAEERASVAALYAWCRRADDAVDCSPVTARPKLLRKLRAELDEIYAGNSLAEPELIAFQRTVRRHGIPKDYPQALLDGLEMDVTQQR